MRCGQCAGAAEVGFVSLTTTSAGLAWALGRVDTEVTRDEALEHLELVASAVDVPVNADFEDCYAVEPDQVYDNVRLAVATGIAGISIADSTRGAAEPLHEYELAAERGQGAARSAIDDSGIGVVLTARTEGFVVGGPDWTRPRVAARP